MHVEYKDLSPSEQKDADKITSLCYDLLDLWDKVLTAKFDPMQIAYLKISFDFYERFHAAEWVINWTTPQGDAGGLKLLIRPGDIEKPGYKHHLFNQIVSQYTRMIYAKVVGEYY